MTGQYALIINGADVTTAESFGVVDPATELVFEQAPAATVIQLDAAVAAARVAFPSWAAKSHPERQAALVAMADIMEAHAGELATLVSREQGKTLGGLGANWEVGGAIAWTRYTASLSLPAEFIQNDADGRVVIERKPVGVVGSITPWNYPLLIAIWHIMPAFLAGNTVVLKPSPYTPLSTLALGRLLQQALPPGVLNVITGQDEIGQAMSDHPDINKIVFTGSSKTGKRVMESAAGSLKRLTLELSGNDAGIILPDIDLDATIEKLFWGIFLNNGQTCAALKRLYVHESRYEEVCARLVDFSRTIKVGNGLDPESQLGAVQNRMQFNRVKHLVDAARADGARILCGGETNGEPGLFYPITILADAKDGMAIVDEEQFGPAIPVLRYRDIDEALARANASASGLGGSVWSSDIEEARRVAARLECGSVWVNAHGAIRPDAPFGGIKQSGIGVEFGVLGLAEYTTVQVIHS
jgi:acyl-CoA reductase-like NAD-dependent aldehyde dehydrogenase